jgi:DNA-binding NtrC family response regulator
MQPLREDRGQLATISPAIIPSEDDLIGLSAESMARLLIDLAHSNPILANQLRRRLEALPLARPAASSRRSAREEPLLVGDSAAMQRVRREIRQFAASDAAVLITGETGTGKELAAHAVHLQSRCARGPFVAVNCAGLPPTLVASELFGHEKGAFTGAHQRKLGRIEAARGGTVFLDEIGDFPFEIQAHLLRFLQEKTIERVGACQPVSVEVRVVAATNKDLAVEVREGRFREDLFYRLHVLRLHLPPLRERADDVELLCRHFLAQFASGPAGALSAEALEALRTYGWPGNVRELMGRVRRAAVTCENAEIRPSDLGFSGSERRRRVRIAATVERRGDAAVPAAARADARAGEPVPADRGFALLPEAMPPTLAAAKGAVEAWMLRTSLQLTGQNVTLAAERLGISRVTLYRLLERHGLRDQHLAGTSPD